MEEYETMPLWKKALVWAFAVAMPFIGSLDGITF